MRPIYSSLTGVGTGPVIPIDQYQSPTSLSLGVTISGTITYTVEYTYDDVFDPAFNPVTADWFDVTGLVGQIVQADAALTAPPRAVRIRTTAGTGTATLAVIQAGAVG